MKWLFILFLSISAFAQEKQRVAIIDTGLKVDDVRFKSLICKDGVEDFTGTGIEDRVGHGTHVAGLIKEHAKDANYCLVILKYFDPQLNELGVMNAYIEALKHVNKKNYKYVNISGGGPNVADEEEEVIKNNPNTTFIVAAGNVNENINVYCPACYHKYDNVIVVGAMDDKENKAPFSNFGPTIRWEKGVNILSTTPGNRKGYMSGSSMSCAIFTGKKLYDEDY